VTDSVLEESATSIMVEVNRKIEAEFSSGSLINTHETIQYHEFKHCCHKLEIRVTDQYAFTLDFLPTVVGALVKYFSSVTRIFMPHEISRSCIRNKIMRTGYFCPDYGSSRYMLVSYRASVEA
jgi:hypothetical protein